MTKLASKRRLWYTISLLVIIPGTLSLLLFGLRLGIDFTGGTLWELQFEQSVSNEQIATVLAAHGYDNTIIQRTGAESDRAYLIRMRELTEGSATKDEIEADLATRLGPFVEREFSTVGGAISTGIRNRAILAIAIASVGILLYMAYAFRNTQNPTLYGICALVAMLHDVLVVIGAFSILGVIAGVEIDALFVTALLTVIGFSVHDTIVVFDRIRENLGRQVSASFEDVVNYSLAQTVVRSLNTSMTVIFTLLALALFGGATTRNFVLALLLGVISGTYSSIFNASQLLVSWESGEIHRLVNRLRGRRAGPAVAPSR